MENISIRQGETLELTVECDDESAVSVRFLATQEGVPYIDKTAQFVDGVATIRTDDTGHPLGDYKFTLTMLYSDGVVDILPDASDCGDNCDLPTLTICESNVAGIVS